MKNILDLFVSVVLIADRSEPVRVDQVRSLEECLRECYAHYEILIVDAANGLISDEVSHKILTTVRNVRHLKLLHLPSCEVMTAAGLENAIGDIMVTGRVDQLSAANIRESVDLCRRGNDIVVGVARKPHTVAYRVVRYLYDVMLGRVIGSVSVPSGDTGFRCVSRRILNVASSRPRFHQFAFLRLSSSGGVQTTIEIQAGSVVGGVMDRRTLSRGIDLVIFNTTVPLRVMNGAAVLMSGLCVAVGLYALVVNVLKDRVVEGWTTLMLVLSSMFFMMFLVLAFIGEYLARLLMDRQMSRPYDVAFERHSSVMLDMSELNVKADSRMTSVNLVQTGRDR